MATDEPRDASVASYEPREAVWPHVKSLALPGERHPHGLPDDPVTHHCEAERILPVTAGPPRNHPHGPVCTDAYVLSEAGHLG